MTYFINALRAIRQSPMPKLIVFATAGVAHEILTSRTIKAAINFENMISAKDPQISNAGNGSTNLKRSR